MSPNGRDHDRSIGPGDSGLALALPGGVALLAVSQAGCVALLRGIIAGMSADPERVAEAWSRAADDPAIAAWLNAEGFGPTNTLTAAVASGRLHELPARLQKALVVAAVPQGRPAAPRGDAAPPAGLPILLREALLAAEAHHALADRFTERVAEARLEALRELAYGAGHEINNPLANIAARAQALLLDEREPERRRRLATIVDQAFRARDMIGGLMLYARPPKPEPVETTVEDVVRPVIEGLASRAAASGVRLDYSPCPRRLGLYVDATQVGEALRMLAVNAIEAVDDGGRVHLESVGEPAAARAKIIVSDNGPGMDADTATRAGDPFFCGREAGRGIGLGLPKARRLIESSGGSLAIESRPGYGTRCIVDLPTSQFAS
jgi:signal transduction histidine kinase